MSAATVLEVLQCLHGITQSSNPYKTAVTAGLSGGIKPNMLRSVYWKIYLGILPTPRTKPTSTQVLLEEWEETMHEQRRALARQQGAKSNGPTPAPQDEKKKKTRFGDSDDDEAEEELKVDNPLSNDVASAYNKDFQRQKLEKTIAKDMERLWSDDPFFESDEVKANMTRVLMDFCDEDADDESHIAGYRQGMHEILSLVFYVLHKDAEFVHQLKPRMTDLDEAQEDDFSILQAVCSPSAVTQDAQLIFTRLMATRRGLGLVHWYHGSIASPKVVASPTGAIQVFTSDTSDNAVVDVANAVQVTMIKVLDEPLWRKLNQELDVQATSYLLRWLRLLFVREFSFSQASVLWDAILAEFSWRVCEEDEENTYNIADSIVPHIAVSMLLFISNDLLEADFSYALRRLMRYPPVEDVRPLLAKSVERRHRGSRIALIAGIMPQMQPIAVISTPLQAPMPASSAAPSSQPSGFGTLPPPGTVLPQQRSTVASPSTAAPPSLASTYGNAARKVEVESLTSLRDRQLRQGMVLASIIRRMEGKWFPDPSQGPMTDEEIAKSDEDYIVAIAELKRVRDVLLNSVSE
jgi:TBC1 domain family member 5